MSVGTDYGLGKTTQEEKEITDCVQTYKEAVDRFSDCPEVRIIKQLSLNAASRCMDESIDFIYIDSCHDYKNVKEDIDAWYPKVKSGGILGGHDYTGSKYHKEHLIRAVDEFVRDNNLTLHTGIADWWVYK